MKFQSRNSLKISPFVIRASFVIRHSSFLARGETHHSFLGKLLALQLGDMPAKGYASHGESWSYALALRLAGYELLRAEGIEPVLALDDVFAELDAGRRDRLAELVGGAAQLLVTCAVPADVPTRLGGVRYEVFEGEVRHAGTG